MIARYFEKQQKPNTFIPFAEDRLFFWLQLGAINMGISQTKQDQKQARRKARPKIFPDHSVESHLTPVRNSSRSGQ